MRKVTLSILAGAAAFAFAMPASGAVTLAPINGPNLDTQIHASKTNTTTNATVVYGSTASGGQSADVQFTANTAVDITENGAGFASISDTPGGGTFTQLIINPTTDFSALQFSVQLVDAGFLLVEYMLDNSGVWLTPTGTDPVSQGNMQLVDYQVTATAGESLGALRLTTCASAVSCSTATGGNGVGIFLEKQNSINLLTTTPPVPEPSTWAMMLVGFGAAGYSLRRRKRVALQAA